MTAKVINFSHLITENQVKQLKILANDEIDIVDISIQINETRDMLPQILAQTKEASDVIYFQKEAIIIIIPPSLAIAATAIALLYMDFKNISYARSVFDDNPVVAEYIFKELISYPSIAKLSL
jgi:hypothetical protein